MLTKDAAICIRAIDYSETSQILTLFTRATGKISAIAKGSKRPKSSFDGPVEAFSSGKIVFTATGGEKLATLTEFQQQPSFPHLRDNLFALNCALFAAELVNHLTHEYDPHPELFDSFLQFLQNANEYQASSIKHRDTLSLLILFQLALLKEVGLQPVLSHCVNCKMSIEHRASSIEHRVYFTSAANGLICRDCEAAFTEKIKLTKNAAACLSNLRILAQTNEKTLKEIEKILIYHFTNILGRPPKMAKHILKP
jgi:DNA repair protein RecO (recombination protein O)